MFWALLIAATVVALSGLAFKFAVPLFRTDPNVDIDWNEFVAGFLAAVIVVIPVVFFVGKAWSTDEALIYQEFYNGVETSATVQVEDCLPGHRGSSASSGHSNCDHEYRNGETYHYTETYYVTVSDGCDAKGNCKSHQEARQRDVLAYIYNPYATKEYRYNISDSLGDDYRFPQTFVKDGEGYNGQAIPADLPRGDPAEWTDAKTHLDEANPRPVTRMFRYDNFILASHNKMLTTFSQDVERYKEAGILPEHTKDIMEQPLHGLNNSQADKISFVGVKVKDESAWQKSLMSFNAALGSELQGDMHLVLIDASLVDNPTDYMSALKAYWSGDDFGRRAIAKNAIIVVAGVQDNKISWAQASTGMPYGNEVMLQGIVNFLPGTTLDPAKVIGAPRTVFTPAAATPTKGDQDDSVKVTVSQNPGVLERVVLQDFPFLRACMACTDDEGNQIGYKRLISQIEPSKGQWAAMISVVALLACIYWVFAAMYRMFDWLPWVNGSPSKSYSDEDDDDDPYSQYRSSSMPLYGTPDFEDRPEPRRPYDAGKY